MPLVTLATKPCNWSLGGGCAMCGYHLGAASHDVTGQDLVVQTQNIIHRLSSQKYPSLVFTSNGSFLDDGEVPDSIRPVLIRMLKDAGFRFMVTETRPEYISEGRLSAMADSFCPEIKQTEKRYPISISMGLESADDTVLKYCINKGTQKKDYEKAFALLNQMRFYFDCYVLLGKPFLTAREDIEDAIDTIRFAVDHGAEYVFVMVTNLTKYSLISYLHSKGRYQLPSLWRAITLLENLPERYRKAVLIKGINHAPVPPLSYAVTCNICTDMVRSCINFWNMTGDMEHLRSLPACSCRSIFLREELSKEGNPLPMSLRLTTEYRKLAKELDVPPRLLHKIE